MPYSYSFSTHHDPLPQKYPRLSIHTRIVLDFDLSCKRRMGAYYHRNDVILTFRGRSIFRMSHAGWVRHGITLGVHITEQQHLIHTLCRSGCTEQITCQNNQETREMQTLENTGHRGAATNVSMQI